MVRTLGGYVRAYLERTGITQAALAEQSGVARVNINRLVKEKVSLPDADTRRKLAKAMGVTHLDMLVAAGELEPDEVLGAGATLTPDDALPPDIRELIAEIDWSDPEASADARVVLRLVSRAHGVAPLSELPIDAREDERYARRRAVVEDVL